MLKIQYISDLHLEMFKNGNYWSEHPLKPVGDILILAGDIINLTKIHINHSFFDNISENFEQVFMIPGNHEFYNLQDYSLLGKKTLDIDIRHNVKLYNNKSILYKDINFVFTMLWSHIPKAYASTVANGMMCFSCIKELDNFFVSKPITIKRYNELHQDCRFFLMNALADIKEGKTIVVTHHAPTISCVSKQYKDSSIRHGFYSEQYDIIKNSNIDYWIYGHTHKNMEEIEIYGTKLVTNQCGYIHMFEQDGLDEEKIIEI